MEITEEQFEKMSLKDQNLIIFRNTNAMMKEMNSIKSAQKIQRWMIASATTISIFSILVILAHVGLKP